MADHIGRPFFWRTLKPYQTAWCDVKVGRKRQDYNHGRRRPAYNAPADYESGLGMHIQGARGEYLTWLWCRPAEWHAYREGDVTGVPDIDDFIDVKTATLHRHCLVVAQNDPDSWAYLALTAEDHPAYPFWGWCWGSEAKAAVKADNRSVRGPAHYIPHGHAILKDPQILLDMLRLRQGGIWE